MSRREPPYGAGKVRQVFADSLFSHTHVVVVQKDGDRESPGNRWRHGRRFKSWNDADQVHEKDENEQRPDERQHTCSTVFQRVMRLARQEFIERFERQLEFAGVFHRKLRASAQRTAPGSLATTRISMVIQFSQGCAGSAAGLPIALKNESSGPARKRLNRAVLQSSASACIDQFVYDFEDDCRCARPTDPIAPAATFGPRNLIITQAPARRTRMRLTKNQADRLLATRADGACQASPALETDVGDAAPIRNANPDGSPCRATPLRLLRASPNRQ